MSDPQTPATFLAPEPSDLAPLFPGYEIESLIATGGMGAVYCAVQKSLDRTVAIKILPQEFSNDAAFCAGFEAEAKAMARLNHPNLIGVYDFGEVNGMLFIVMEYVPGQSIFHSAHGIAIDTAEVIRLVTGICNGLAHAHEHGILHRDIKPSNILLELNAQPKIGDFGLARPIETKIREGDEIFGTPHYTAPEVVNSPHSVDYRADIFSVGVILHELLTGVLPADDRRSASAIVRCDPRFDAIVRRATNPLPEYRYASALEIANDLHAIASSAGHRVLRTFAPAGSPRLTPGRAMPITTTKHSSNLPGIVMLLVAIVIAGVTFVQFSKREETQTSPSKESPTESPQELQKDVVTPVIEPLLQPQLAAEPSFEMEPEVDPEPEPDPPQNSQPELQPTPVFQPDPVGPAHPTFDVAEFFLRARQIMQTRAAPLIANRDKSLEKNLTDYERGAKRLIRRIDSEWQQKRSKELLDAFMEACRLNENRIAQELANASSDVREIRTLRREFFGKQTAIDDALLLELAGLSSVYILGLDKQIGRLNADKDAAEITLIEKETEHTRTDADYFPKLMGITSTKEAPRKINAGSDEQ